MSDLLIPIAQVTLAFALLLVAILCLRLDGKLNAMRKGNDGVAKTIGQLNAAVTRAEAAIKALRAHTDDGTAALQKRIDEAKSVGDSLTFLASTARALEPKPQQLNARDILPEPKPSWDDDDFRPARREPSSASRWSGLR
jgi:hypothetical protein